MREREGGYDVREREGMWCDGEVREGGRESHNWLHFEGKHRSLLSMVNSVNSFIYQMWWKHQASHHIPVLDAEQS